MFRSTPRRGQGLGEYGLIIALVVVGVIVVIGLLGDNISSVFNTANSTMAGATMPGGDGGGDEGGLYAVEECTTYTHTDPNWDANMSSVLYDENRWFTGEACLTVTYDTTGATTGTTTGSAEATLTFTSTSDDTGFYPDEKIHFYLYGTADIDQFADGASESKSWAQSNGFDGPIMMSEASIGDTFVVTLPASMPAVATEEFAPSDPNNLPVPDSSYEAETFITLTIPAAGFPGS